MSVDNHQVLELMCMLSKLPVPIRSLQADLSLGTNTGLMRKLLSAVTAKYGIRLCAGGHDGQRCVWVDPRDWPTLSKVTARYVERVRPAWAVAPR